MLSLSILSILLLVSLFSDSVIGQQYKISKSNGKNASNYVISITDKNATIGIKSGKVNVIIYNGTIPGSTIRFNQSDNTTINLIGHGIKSPLTVNLTSIKPSMSNNTISILPNSANLNTTQYYSPSPVTVPLGTTVNWTNNDTTIHTATSTDSTFDSGIIVPGDTFSFKFDKVGTFNYICTLHPFMKGTIIIK